jgi:uncharacterized membrane protein
VKRERVKVLSDVPSSDAMKFVVSGGVTEIDEEDHGSAAKDAQPKDDPTRG